jgi:hypothetical protein
MDEVQKLNKLSINLQFSRLLHKVKYVMENTSYHAFLEFYDFFLKPALIKLDLRFSQWWL